MVSSFEFRLHEVDPTVQVGLFFWDLDQGREALCLTREITAAMPPDVNAVIAALNAPPLPFVPEQHHFAPGYALVLTGFGAAPDHARLVTEVHRALPPLFDLVTPMPYVVLQQMLDEANAWGQHGYDKATYVESLYAAFIVGLAPDADLLAADRRWVRDFWAVLRPHAIGSGDGYVNGSTDFQDDQVRNSYGAGKYERLAKIKAEYDPDNVFHLNVNIAPG